MWAAPTTAFRPLELMAVSLAGCTAMDVISIVRKKKQDVTAFEVKVHADQQGEHPHVFTHIVIEYHFSGSNIDEAAVVRAIELSSVKYCPAQSMLEQGSANGDEIFYPRCGQRGAGKGRNLAGRVVLFGQIKICAGYDSGTDFLIPGLVFTLRP